MLEPPTMAKRHRTRPRTRRGIEAARRTTTPSRVERVETPARQPTHRPVRTSRSGWSRAIGNPSASLERAAVVERAFIGRDFRRLGVVVAVGLVVLVIAG